MRLFSGLFRVMQLLKKQHDIDMDVTMPSGMAWPTLDKVELAEDEALKPRARRFSDTPDYVPGAGPSYAHPYTRKSDGPEPELKPEVLLEVAPEPKPVLQPVPQLKRRKVWKLDSPSPKYDGEL